MLHRTAVIPVRRDADAAADPARLIDAVDACAAALNELIDSLHKHATVPAGRFSNLARRILVDVSESTSLATSIFRPGVSLAAHLRRSYGIDRGPVMADGIQAALIAALLATADELEQDETEALIVAALLHHVGLLSLARGCGMPVPVLLEEKPDVAQQHPSFGAALVGGIRCDTTLPVRLVAEHHERLDGTGFPRGLSDREMSPLSPRLTLVCRAVELASPAVAHKAIRRDGVILDERPAAAIALHREAQHGEFDIRLTARLLELLGFEIRATSVLDESKRRIDAAHADLPAPHVPSMPSQRPRENYVPQRAAREIETTSGENQTAPRPYFLDRLRSHSNERTTLPSPLHRDNEWVHNED